MESMKGRLILVVGASAGIGAQTAITLSEKGARVILLARREDKLIDVKKKLAGEGHDYYCLDVNEIDQIDTVVGEIVKKHGTIDGLVYATGRTDDYPIRQLTYQKQIDVFNVNYFAFVEFVRQVCRKGRYCHGLRIVSISSIAAFFGNRAHLAYSASKAAMDAAVRCIAKEYASKGICINSVAPSWTMTEMTRKYIEMNGEESETVKNMLNRQYLGMGEPIDIANAIIFLLSSEARLITGTTLPIDGGYSVG